jgi:hypothetical protein
MIGFTTGFMLMKINNFILNSDYATIKNDTQSNTISVTIASGTTFTPSTLDVEIGISTLDVGTINAGIRARGKSSKHADWVVGTTLFTDFLVSYPAYPGIGTISQTFWCYLKRIDADTVKLLVTYETAVGAPQIKIEETVTISFVFSTFLSPFD